MSDSFLAATVTRSSDAEALQSGGQMMRPPLVVPPSGPHTHTVILLHGCYCQGEDFSDVPELLLELCGDVHGGDGMLSGIKFIFPNAPLRTLHWPQGTEFGQSAWYDYFTSCSNSMRHDDIDEGQLAEITAELTELVRSEAAALGDPKRVIVGGNSQGGTTAAHLALTLGEELGGLIFLRSVLMDVTPVRAERAALPVFVFHAPLDTEYCPALQRRGAQRLTDAGYAVTWHTEKDCDHYMYSRAELYWAAAWIALLVSGRTVTVAYRDADHLPDDAMAKLPADELSARLVVASAD